MGLIENTKEIADLIKKIGDIELYRKIVELEEEIFALTREKRQLEEDNSELQKKLAQQKNLAFQEPFWYAIGDSVPYCARCWEKEKAAVHVIYHGKFMYGHKYECPECDYVVHLNALVSPPALSQTLIQEG